jgi:hypothetical protein
LADPCSLDISKTDVSFGSEVSSAAFLDDQRLVVGTSEESFLDDRDFEDPRNLRPNSLAVWDIDRKEFLSRVNVSQPIGTILPVDPHHIVSFYDHPKIIDLTSGVTVASLPELRTGKQQSSIIHHVDPLPPLAIDCVHKRFAVATENMVHVIGVS